jgi:hypothetical protein
MRYLMSTADTDEALQSRIIAMQQSGPYAETNFTHFRKLLEEWEGIVISHTALSGILKGAGIAVISFDFSAVCTCRRKPRLVRPGAHDMNGVSFSAFTPFTVSPSTETTEPALNRSLKYPRVQERKHPSNFRWSIRPNTRKMVSAPGIPCGRAGYFLNHCP